MIVAQMTKKEAIRRLENLALATGHKRNYYVKRALVEFLDRNEHLLGRRHTNGFRDPPRSLLPPEAGGCIRTLAHSFFVSIYPGADLLDHDQKAGCVEHPKHIRLP